MLKFLPKKNRPIVFCIACQKQVEYPIDYILAMVLEHRKETGHNEFTLTIPEKLQLQIE